MLVRLLGAFPTSYNLHTQPRYVDQLRDPYCYHLYYSHLVHSYCQYFDLDVNYSCPCYDIFDECYARLNSIIETMNERHECFVSEIKKSGILCETNPSLPSPRIEVMFYDDYESSFPLESNFVINLQSA